MGGNCFLICLCNLFGDHTLNYFQCSLHLPLEAGSILIRYLSSEPCNLTTSAIHWVLQLSPRDHCSIPCILRQKVRIGNLQSSFLHSLLRLIANLSAQGVILVRRTPVLDGSLSKKILLSPGAALVNIACLGIVSPIYNSLMYMYSTCVCQVRSLCIRNQG